MHFVDGRWTPPEREDMCHTLISSNFILTVETVFSLNSGPLTNVYTKVYTFVKVPECTWSHLQGWHTVSCTVRTFGSRTKVYTLVYTSPLQTSLKCILSSVTFKRRTKVYTWCIPFEKYNYYIWQRINCLVECLYSYAACIYAYIYTISTYVRNIAASPDEKWEITQQHVVSDRQQLCIWMNLYPNASVCLLTAIQITAPAVSACPFHPLPSWYISAKKERCIWQKLD